MSILSQEEIGKAFLLEEHVFQYDKDAGKTPPDLERLMIDALSSHRVKQGWFSRQVGDFFKYKGLKRFPKILREIEGGMLEDNKQNATYVGLTKTNKKMNPRGKIIVPTARIKLHQPKNHITRVNDFIIELVEGCRRGVTSVDTEELDSVLTLELARELEQLWPDKSRSTIMRLRNIRKFSVEQRYS